MVLSLLSSVSIYHSPWRHRIAHTRLLLNLISLLLPPFWNAVLWIRVEVDRIKPFKKSVFQIPQVKPESKVRWLQISNRFWTGVHTRYGSREDPAEKKLDLNFFRIRNRLKWSGSVALVECPINSTINPWFFRLDGCPFHLARIWSKSDI